VAEVGAPEALARHLHVRTPLHHLEWYADMAGRELVTPLPPTVTPLRTGGSWLGSSVAVREPIGVVAAITPFNFPFFLNVEKVGPALATGNTVVLKPSPFTPLQALVIAEAAEEAGLPAGVVNVVTGGIDVGSG